MISGGIAENVKTVQVEGAEKNNNSVDEELKIHKEVEIGKTSLIDDGCDDVITIEESQSPTLTSEKDL